MTTFLIPVTTLCLILSFNINLFAQNPLSPKFTSFEPINVNNSGPTQVYNYYQEQAISDNTPTGEMSNANITNNWTNLNVDQRNRAVMLMHGIKPPPTQEEIAQNLYREIHSPQPFKKALTEYEKISIELLNEANRLESTKRVSFEYYKSPKFKAEEQPFKDAANYINQMLSGNKSLSVKNAYYQMEKAYGNTYLTYQEYSKTINDNADFIKKWLLQNGYDLKNNEALNIGIQNFMRDTLYITISIPDSKEKTKTIKHLPYRYDYVDFMAEKDHRNYFITKCLATGYGQCNSLPGAYLVIAEALGAKSYLTFAPQHSFIKYPDNKGFIHNYEPTSHYKINDQWYEDNMHIGKVAKKSGIYLDTLNRKQIVASCLEDLAFGYMTKLGVADGKFMTDCIKDVIKEFPKGNNIQAYFIQSSILSHTLDKILYEKGIKNFDEIDKVPEAKKIYLALVNNETMMSKLGYQPMPEAQYLEMMNMHENRAKTQQEQKIIGKQKRSLFIKGS